MVRVVSRLSLLEGTAGVKRAQSYTEGINDSCMMNPRHLDIGYIA